MNNYESLDTSIILRVFLTDDAALQERALRLLSRQDKKFWLDKLAVTEAVFQLEKRQRWTRQAVERVIRAFISRPNISCNVGMLSDAFDLYVAHPKLSFNDCCLAVEAAIAGSVPLWTLDRKLAGQTGGLARLA